MLKVFQKDVSLLGVLLLVTFDFIGMMDGIQSFALENFRIPLGFLRFFPFSSIVYIKINLTILPNKGAFSNLFIF